MVKRRNSLLVAALLAAVTVMAGCGGGGGDKNSVDRPTSITDVTENKQAILAYLSDLTNDVKPGVISGQNCGHGNEIAASGLYNQYVDNLHNNTGQYVGIVGIDYEYMREFTLNELLQANNYLKRHWLKGGLVTINWSPTNPWGSKNNYEDIRTQYPGTDLNLLITDGSPVYSKWMAKLDKIAAALDDLQQWGVVVMWRPMQEMNGNWFWWGKQNVGQAPHPGYIAVWRHMYNYFTNVKKLKNLLWVFSPTQSESFSSFPYPGDEYVDILGPTQYADDLSIPGYADYVRYNKPIGMAEYGPSEFNSLVLTGALDDRLYVQSLKANPKVAFWVTWHSWKDGTKTVHMALVDNQHANELMNDPYVINRGALHQ